MYLENKFTAQSHIDCTMNAVNETLIRDVVAEVLGKLGGAPALERKAPPVPGDLSFAPAASRGSKPGKFSAASASLRGKFGVFQDAKEACAAAQEAYLLLNQ